ncbi:MAG: adenosylcobinamide-phosphate synthase CbiB [Desulfobacteraceae bacterium]
MGELHCYAILTAYILDLLLGDPRILPHPVAGMGKAIAFFEPRFRKIICDPFKAGLFFALFLIISTWGITWVIITGATALHPVFGACAQCIFLFFCFSITSLDKAASEVKDALENQGIETARKKIAMIVGREVNTLDRSGIIKAGIETVSENFVDGFLSPLCFALAGGAPLAMAYKMVNTLDSMVGYKNEKYILFGRAAAKIDDLANYIPARISLAVISFAAAMIDIKKGKQAFKTGFLEGKQHSSPNAGYPEAAFAGALQIRLGGPNMYHGALVKKPYIGINFSNPELNSLKKACDLMLLSSLVAVSAVCFFCFFII